MTTTTFQDELMRCLSRDETGWCGELVAWSRVRDGVTARFHYWLPSAGEYDRDRHVSLELLARYGIVLPPALEVPVLEARP